MQYIRFSYEDRICFGQLQGEAIDLFDRSYLEAGHDFHDAPAVFLKPVTSLAGPEDEIILPAMSRQVDYEAGLVVVIGKTAKDLAEAQAEIEGIGRLRNLVR